MKISSILIGAFLVLAGANVHAELATNGNGPGNGMDAAEFDCIDAIQKTLNLTEGERVEIKGGQSNDGLSCELALKYDRANSGITHKDYRSLGITPSAVIRFANGDLSQLAPVVMARLEDNTNGTDKYTITKCEVNAERISLKFARKQKFAWHTKFKYEFDISLRDGKVASIKTSGDGAKNAVCKF